MISQLSSYFNLRNTLTQFFIFISCFALVSFGDVFFFSTRAEQTDMLIILIAQILAVCGCVYVIHDVLNRTELNPMNIAVTGIIIFLLLHPLGSLLPFVAALVFAASSKLVRFRSQPIVNPAATGIAIVSYLATLLGKPVIISWWGADMVQNFTKGNLFLYYGLGTIFLGFFIYFAWKFKKSSYIVTFIMTALMLIFWTNLHTTNSSSETIAFIISSLFNSFAFLALVMIPEPKTSPVFAKQQLVVGVLGGIVFFVLFSEMVPFLPSDLAFIHTVFAMNLMTFGFKYTGWLR